jgi:hypothetical protein
MFKVKVIKLPGAVKEYYSDGSVSVDEIIDEVGFTVDSNERFEFNGSSVDSDYVPSAEGELIILKSIKGN